MPRASSLLYGGSTFVAASLLVLIGCGGDGGPVSTNPPAGNGLPEIIRAPFEFTTLNDGTKVTMQLLDRPNGVVEGEVMFYPPTGSGKLPELFRASGSKTNIDLVSLAENNADVDYRLEGADDAGGEFEGILKPGPGADGDDAPEQEVDFQENVSVAKPVKLDMSRAAEYITAKFGSDETGTQYYRFRFEPAVVVDEWSGTTTYRIGYRVCLDCDGKFSDYTEIYASVWDGIADSMRIRLEDKDGDVGWGVIGRSDGKFHFPGGVQVMYLLRAPGLSGNHWGRFSDVTGAKSIPRTPWSRQV